MKTYLPKAKNIKAIHFDGSQHSIHIITKELESVTYYHVETAPYILFHTRYGNKLAFVGDYIVIDALKQPFVMSRQAFESVYQTKPSSYTTYIQPILDALYGVYLEFKGMTFWNKMAVWCVFTVCLYAVVLILSLQKDLTNLKIAEDILQDCKLTPAEVFEWNKF